MASKDTFHELTEKLALLVIQHGDIFKNEVPESYLPNKFTTSNKVRQRLFVREVIKHLDKYVEGHDETTQERAVNSHGSGF